MLLLPSIASMQTYKKLVSMRNMIQAFRLHGFGNTRPVFLNLGNFHHGAPDVGLVSAIFKNIKLSWPSDIAL
jgi:hypothetical protein